MGLSADIRARISARQTGANDFGGPDFNPEVERFIQLTHGVAANQADVLWADHRSIAASGTDNIDLAGVLIDAFGATVTMAKAVTLLVTADAANVNNVIIGDGTNPVALFGGTNPTFSVKPGGFFMVGAPALAGLFSISGGSTDILKLANSAGGSAVGYNIAIIGRSA